MKSLHRPDLYSWSAFDEARNVDFHGLCWARPDTSSAGGNVLVDPMPLSAHDRAHLESLGGVALIVLTNSDHTRAAQEIAAWSGAKIAGPAAEKETFPFPCDRWLEDGDEVVPGLVVHAMAGSKTPGELALVLDGTTLITGDLVRAHKAGSLMLLPDAKLVDKAAAVASVRKLAAIDTIDTVLVGDGWPLFGNGGNALRALAARLG
ncbi:MAG: MBL fold metallo-hydrolase [Pseudomonadota bacterium]|nr:MBL fold metallo-hydrolase [Pseudomonadota bacterium]